MYRLPTILFYHLQRQLRCRLALLTLPLWIWGCTVDQDRDGFSEADDCDDTSPVINPSAPDIVGDDLDQNCDGIDGTDGDGDGHASLSSGGDDCDDSQVNITNKRTYYQDYDSDGFGNSRIGFASCERPFGYVDNADDCNDTDDSVHPDAQEICDRIDNDCDERTDDADESVSDQIDLFLDTDQDGFGSSVESYRACFPNAEYADNADDCNDFDAGIHPNAADIPYDNIDQNCDGEDGISDAVYLSADLRSDTAIEAFCAEYDAITVFGDITIDLTAISGNSTEPLDCIVSIEGELKVLNIRNDSIVSFANLYYAGDIALEGGLYYNFPNLIAADRLSISANRLWPVFSGDDAFPNLQRLENDFVWIEGRGTELSGFTQLTSLRGLFIEENYVLSEITAFPNIKNLEILAIRDTHSSALPNLSSSPLLTFSGPEAIESITHIEIRNNGYLATPALEGLESSRLVLISDNQRLAQDPCTYLTIHSNLVLSQISHEEFELANCDIDGDSLSPNSGDCDDQNPEANTTDADGDSFSGCDGDCNDADSTIHPLAVEIPYDGIDQNCDGANDYDQDGDHDLHSNFGGLDCDDQNPLVSGLDPDQDGQSTCSNPTEVERVESCLAWQQAGASTDGIYTLSFPNGDSVQVYCNMTTEGGGWTLFAVTNANACTENLPFGSDEVINLSTPYFSTRLNSTLSSEFLQEVRADGEHSDYTISWQFLDAPATLSERFLQAYSSGTLVSWDVAYDGYQYNYLGRWFFSDNAYRLFNGELSHPWNAWLNWEEYTTDPQPLFSADDGAWAAASDIVNGNGDLLPLWGQAVNDVSDVSPDDRRDCSTVYINGSAYPSSELLNLMYFR